MIWTAILHLQALHASTFASSDQNILCYRLYLNSTGLSIFIYLYFKESSRWCWISRYEVPKNICTPWSWPFGFPEFHNRSICWWGWTRLRMSKISLASQRHSQFIWPCFVSSMIIPSFVIEIVLWHTIPTGCLIAITWSNHMYKFLPHDHCLSFGLIL